MRCRVGIVICGCLIAAAGCSSTVAWPNWFNPGPANYQRAAADRFDPYPDSVIGPQVAGTRPRDFDEPRPPPPLVAPPWGRSYSSEGYAPSAPAVAPVVPSAPYYPYVPSAAPAYVGPPAAAPSPAPTGPPPAPYVLPQAAPQ